MNVLKNTNDKPDEKKITIIGTCVVRDCFEIAKEYTETVKFKNIKYSLTYFGGPSIRSMFSDPFSDEEKKVLLELKEKSTCVNFFKKTFDTDIEKNLFSHFGEFESDWLIIDFGFILRESLTKQKTSITKFIFTELYNYLDEDNRKKFADLKNRNIYDPVFEDRVSFLEEYGRFLSKLKRLHNPKKIIFINTHYAKYAVDKEFKHIENIDLADALIEKSNELYDQCFALAKKMLRKSHFIDAFPINVTNINHKWGKYHLHFIDETYLYMYDSIFEIIHSKNCFSKRRELKLIKERYVNLVNEKLANVDVSTIEENNIVERYDKMTPDSKYFKNGLTLRIGKNLNFSLKGYATADTTFYLLNYSGNPLDNWKSVRETFEAENYHLMSGTSANDNFFVQFVFSNGPEERKWVTVNRGADFTAAKDYSCVLVRIVIKKHTSIDGCEGRIGIYKRGVKSK